MTTGNTTLLGLALPVEGELDGTWGDIVNNSITSLLDSAIAGTTTLSVDADVTLSTTNLAANEARQAVILWTASNGALRATLQLQPKQALHRNQRGYGVSCTARRRPNDWRYDYSGRSA
jgi:hypothetical protein